VHRGIDAVNKCRELALHFPTELSELKEVAIEFQGKSSFGVLFPISKRKKLKFLTAHGNWSC
jgi:hypothetical protein